MVEELKSVGELYGKLAEKYRYLIMRDNIGMDIHILDLSKLKITYLYEDKETIKSIEAKVIFTTNMHFKIIGWYRFIGDAILFYLNNHYINTSIYTFTAVNVSGLSIDELVDKLNIFKVKYNGTEAEPFYICKMFKNDFYNERKQILHDKSYFSVVDSEKKIFSISTDDMKSILGVLECLRRQGEE